MLGKRPRSNQCESKTTHLWATPGGIGPGAPALLIIANRRSWRQAWLSPPLGRGAAPAGGQLLAPSLQSRTCRQFGPLLRGDLSAQMRPDWRTAGWFSVWRMTKGHWTLDLDRVCSCCPVAILPLGMVASLEAPSATSAPQLWNAGVVASSAEIDRCQLSILLIPLRCQALSQSDNVAPSNLWAA